MRLFRRRADAPSSLDLLVAGLGNPGREYAAHRHNVGRLVAEELGRRLDASWRGKFSGRLAEVRLDDLRLALLVPETYMNESGRSVGAAVRFFKVDVERLLVVHDEADFELGRLQLRRGGGLAGHNGLRSVAGALGTQDFMRLRVGVGRPGRDDRRDVADYLLADFEPADDAEALVQRAADAVVAGASDGLEPAQARFN